jgi:catechol 2,3-dioxygenase-like lactoylglutathione lyase family enzyme
MLDDVSLAVGDIERSRRFYDAALRPLGLIRVDLDDGTVSDYRTAPGAHANELTLKHDLGIATLVPAAHLSFRARDPAAVNAFHLAALAVGGRDDAPPALRPHYHPSYYSAVVVDPDGHRIEAACLALRSPALFAA